MKQTIFTSEEMAKIIQLQDQSLSLRFLIFKTSSEGSYFNQVSTIILNLQTTHL